MKWSDWVIRVSRFGLVVTQEGVDIKNAPDYQQSINSDWPLLELAFNEIISAQFNVTSTELTFVLFEHNLGFVPYFAFMSSVGGPGTIGEYPLSDYTGAFGAYDSYTLTIDSKKVYVTFNIQVALLPASFAVRGRLHIYNYDTATEFHADSSISGRVGNRRSRYGLSVLKNSVDRMADRDTRKFSFTSRAKSLVVHKSGVGVAGNNPEVPIGGGAGTIKIVHDLGYLPTYLIGGSPNGLNGLRAFATESALYFTGVQSALADGTKVSYLILKDPLLENHG